MSQTETPAAVEPAIPPDPIVHKSYAVPIWIASLAVVAATVLTIADEGWFRRPYKGVQAQYRETYSAYLEKVEAKRRAFYVGVLTNLDDFKKVSETAAAAEAASHDEAAKIQFELETANDKGRKMTEAAKDKKSEIAALGYAAENKAHAAGHEKVEESEEAKALLAEIERIRESEVSYKWNETVAGEGGTSTTTEKSATGKVADVLAEALAIEAKKAELQQKLAKVTAAASAALKAKTEWVDANRSNLTYV